MRRFHKLLWMAAVALVAGTLGSCLEDDETATTPQCAILTFEVSDISTTVTTLTQAGNDTTYTRTLDGDDIYFNIDQVNNQIVSVDSLPTWVDLSRVVVTMSSLGTVYCDMGTNGETYYAFTSGSDSIDFSNGPVRFLVQATDGSSQRVYTAQIFKHSQDVDSLYWTEAQGLQLEGKHRTVALDGTLYCFAENGGSPTVTWAEASASGLSWTGPLALEGSDATIDYASVTPWDGALYALDSDGALYRSTSLQRGQMWTKAGSQQLERLLCGDSNYLYGFDGTQIVATADLVNWAACGASDMDCLPASPVQSAFYTATTNSGLEHVVMLGLTGAATDCAAAWYKVSAADADLDQDWNYIELTDDNSYGMPALANLQMFCLKRSLYAFGSPYEYLYRSDDNGVTWHPLTEEVMLPEAVRGTSAPLTAVEANGLIWLLQSGGRVWCGRLIE